MASLDSALLNIPVLREMLALEQFDSNERAKRAAETFRVIDAAGKLAEIQSLPEQARLRRAQAAKAEFEIEQARRSQAGLQAAAQAHLQPREVPVQGPTMPGEPPLGSVVQQPGPQAMQGFINQLMQNPATIAQALALKKDLRGEYVPIPAGGLFHTGSETVIPGVPSNPLAKARQEVEDARASGDPDRIARAEEYERRVAEGSRGSGTMAQVRRITELLTKYRSGIPLTEAEKVELEYLHGFLGRAQMVTDAQGHSRTFGPLNVPLAGSLIDQALGRTGGAPASGSGTSPLPGQQSEAGQRPPTGGGRGEPLPTADTGAKALGIEQTKLLSSRMEYMHMLRSLVQDYEPSFNPKLARLDPTGLVAGAYKEIDRRGLGSDARADWWRNLGKFVAPERHELFGATLTDQEKLAYEELQILMRDSPELVHSTLRTMLQRSEGELKSLSESLRSMYNPAQIDAYTRKENPYAFGKRGIERGKFTESVEEIKRDDKIIRLKTRTYKDGRKVVFDDGKWHDVKE